MLISTDFATSTIFLNFVLNKCKLCHDFVRLYFDEVLMEVWFPL